MTSTVTMMPDLEIAVGQAWELIETAERDLGLLSRGRRRDLLKDNTEWHADFVDVVEQQIETLFPASEKQEN